MNLPEGYTISTDKNKLDIKVIHDFLSNSYWAKNIPVEIVKYSIENSLCFGVYYKEKLIGFARVISDFATFAYLGDVFILEEHRGKGLSKILMKEVFSHPQLQGLRRFCLGTRDAHKLYEQFGFYLIKKPELWMEIKHENIYSEKSI
ncbi:MAG TPA: GNAT family N-acetyltransferase [Bacteroidia bacterium]|nr:GNAT family N-acetyltransferase [Bacteroidia bacterium]